MVRAGDDQSPASSSRLAVDSKLASSLDGTGILSAFELWWHWVISFCLILVVIFATFRANERDSRLRMTVAANSIAVLFCDCFDCSPQSGDICISYFSRQRTKRFLVCRRRHYGYTVLGIWE